MTRSTETVISFEKVISFFGDQWVVSKTRPNSAARRVIALFDERRIGW